MMEATIPFLDKADLIFNDSDTLYMHRYATFDYEEGEYRPADLLRLDILAHGKPVDALTRMVARSEADSLGRSIIGKMKEMMERQQFDVVLQV